MIPVPVVELSDLSAASMEELDAACRAHGCFGVTGHGLDDLTSQLWERRIRAEPPR